LEAGAVSIDWDGYEIYDPGVHGPLGTLPRAGARRAFDALMTARPSRNEILRRLLKANGLDLGSSDLAIQDLNDWFREHVQDDPDSPGRLLPEWYSVVNDLSLFLGDVMIERHPNLSWTFYTWGKTNVSYQRHVIMGFAQVPNPKYCVDVDRVLATYAHRIVAGHQDVEPDAFLRWLAAAAERA
jgi:hypothetical protein